MILETEWIIDILLFPCILFIYPEQLAPMGNYHRPSASFTTQAFIPRAKWTHTYLLTNSLIMLVTCYLHQWVLVSCLSWMAQPEATLYSCIYSCIMYTVQPCIIYRVNEPFKDFHSLIQTLKFAKFHLPPLVGEGGKNQWIQHWSREWIAVVFPTNSDWTWATDRAANWSHRSGGQPGFTAVQRCTRGCTVQVVLLVARAPFGRRLHAGLRLGCGRQVTGRPTTNLPSHSRSFAAESAAADATVTHQDF